MRYLLAALLLASACAKKPAPKSPANAAPAEPTVQDKEETGAKNANAPEQEDDAPKDMKADPCDGGE